MLEEFSVIWQRFLLNDISVTFEEYLKMGSGPI